MPVKRPLRLGWIVWLNLLACCGCVKQPEQSVVVYSAADREYAKPILDAFQRRSAGLTVVPQFDVESTKTVGLANRIIDESQQPRCDLFWNNEILHTLTLEKKGLLKSIRWDIPSHWPVTMRSADDKWVGIAARARVLLVNTQRLPDSGSWPNSINDLTDAKWSKQCGVARPLFGTTATHFTVLIDQMGAQASADFFEKVRDNAVVLSGNKQVAIQVAAGQLSWGLTDTDDALVEIDAGMPVQIVFPDQLPGQMGTLRIPNTVAVLENSPHPVAAELLANYLVSQDTEGRLALGASGQFPLRPEHPTESRLQQGRGDGRWLVRWMDVDFYSAAQRWPEASQQLSAIFQ